MSCVVHKFNMQFHIKTCNYQVAKRIDCATISYSILIFASFCLHMVTVSFNGPSLGTYSSGSWYKVSLPLRTKYKIIEFVTR